MAKKAHLLFVDAHDSFSQNIVALLYQLLDVTITTVPIELDVRDELFIHEEPFFNSFDAIILGPGPGHPKNETDIGLFTSIWRIASNSRIPVLGICLGFQSLCLTYGAPITFMKMPCHGQSRRVLSSNDDILADVGEISATNYNSLGVPLGWFENDLEPSRPGSSASIGSGSSFFNSDLAVSVPSQPIVYAPKPCRNHLVPLGWNDAGYVMAVKHNLYPFWGLQFHPESCKSNEACHKILVNWWTAAQKHNLEMRTIPNRTIPTRTSGWAFQEVQVEDGTISGRMLKKVLQLTNFAACEVQSRTMPLVCDVEEISQLCIDSSAWAKVAMLESTKKGRFSIYAISDDKVWQLEHKAGSCKALDHQGNVIAEWPCEAKVVMQVVEDLMVRRRVSKGRSEVPFWGGFVGYLSYEMGLASVEVDQHRFPEGVEVIPDISLMWVDRSIVVDKEQGVVHIQSIRKYDLEWISTTTEALQQLGTKPPSSSATRSPYFHDALSGTTIQLPSRTAYLSQIRSCISQLMDGNSYELCLTTEALVRTPNAGHIPWLFYRSLRRHNPVPYSAFLHLNGTHILSSSPESFLTWTRSGKIDMIPMKGTVQKSPTITFQHAQEILSTPKEAAENLMIADLIRHDLYSTVGHEAKVEVVKLCEVVEHETVYQLVSHIRAHMPVPADSTATAELTTHYGMESLRRALPPGSMTGAPKKRSCEILRDLEKRARGVYSGVLGYMDVGGGGAWNVCIRTAFSQHEEDADELTWHIGAGGAITVLSDEEAEWEEMMGKLESVLSAFRPDDH